MTTIDYAALLKMAQNQTAAPAAVPAAAAPAAQDPAALLAQMAANPQMAALLAQMAAGGAPAATLAPGTIAPAPAISAAVEQAYAGDNPFTGAENAEISEYGVPPLPRGVKRDPMLPRNCDIVSVEGDGTYDLVFKKCERKTSRKGIVYVKAYLTVLDGNGSSDVGSDVEVVWFKNNDYFDKEVKGFAMALLNLNKNDKPAIAKALLDLIHPKAPFAGKPIRVRSAYGGKGKKEPHKDYFRYTWTPVVLAGQDPQTGKPIIQLAQDNRGL